MEKEKYIEVFEYFIKSAEIDYDSMIVLFDNQKYAHSLFFGHISIEKLLKAAYVHRKNDYPPYIHNLVRLAEKSDISLNPIQKLHLTTITAFNINARYDDYKLNFHKKCTYEYTSKWLQIIKDTKLWIEQLIKI
jgi:HEPN domain-containing protein